MSRCRRPQTACRKIGTRKMGTVTCFRKTMTRTKAVDGSFHQSRRSRKARPDPDVLWGPGKMGTVTCFRKTMTPTKAIDGSFRQSRRSRKARPGPDVLWGPGPAEKSAPRPSQSGGCGTALATRPPPAALFWPSCGSLSKLGIHLTQPGPTYSVLFDGILCANCIKLK